jgi:hypothetical protein
MLLAFQVSKARDSEMSAPVPDLEAPLLIVAEDQRYRYGLDNQVEILATSQPARLCLFDESLREGDPATRKNIYPPACPELERFWLETFQESISNFLFNMPVVSQRCWKVEVGRLGFEAKDLDNPIVIRFVFDCGDVTNELARQLVEGIDDLVVTQGWEGEK